MREEEGGVDSRVVREMLCVVGQHVEDVAVVAVFCVVAVAVVVVVVVVVVLAGQGAVAVAFVDKSVVAFVVVVVVVKICIVVVVELCIFVVVFVDVLVVIFVFVTWVIQVVSVKGFSVDFFDVVNFLFPLLHSIHLLPTTRSINSLHHWNQTTCRPL